MACIECVVLVLLNPEPCIIFGNIGLIWLQLLSFFRLHISSACRHRRPGFPTVCVRPLADHAWRCFWPNKHPGRRCSEDQGPQGTQRRHPCIGQLSWQNVDRSWDIWTLVFFLWEFILWSWDFCNAPQTTTYLFIRWYWRLVLYAWK